MTEYKPRLRNRGINPPFGYFVSPVDPNVILPNPEALESLEYSFKMRAKYKTSIRDCCMWLHGQTGLKMSPAGYMYAYKRWATRLRREKCQQLAARRREEMLRQEKLIEDKFNDFTVITDDKDSIQSLAEFDAAKKIKEKYQKAS